MSQPGGTTAGAKPHQHVTPETSTAYQENQREISTVQQSEGQSVLTTL